MIAEVLKLIAEKGPMLYAAYSRLMKHESKSKPTIRYMTPDEEMRYLISTHDENNR